jgi:hypothetical protein
MVFKEYLTMAQAAAAVGCSRRTLYRVVARVGAGDVVTQAFGKQLIHKSKVPLLRKAYLPLGTERRLKASIAWGSAGGTQKSVNRRRAAKKV